MSILLCVPALMGMEEKEQKKEILLLEKEYRKPTQSFALEKLFEKKKISQEDLTNMAKILYLQSCIGELMVAETCASTRYYEKIALDAKDFDSFIDVSLSEIELLRSKLSEDAEEKLDLFDQSVSKKCEGFCFEVISNILDTRREYLQKTSKMFSSLFTFEAILKDSKTTLSDIVGKIKTLQNLVKIKDLSSDNKLFNDFKKATFDKESSQIFSLWCDSVKDCFDLQYLNAIAKDCNEMSYNVEDLEKEYKFFNPSKNLQPEAQVLLRRLYKKILPIKKEIIVPLEIGPIKVEMKESKKKEDAENPIKVFLEPSVVYEAMQTIMEPVLFFAETREAIDGFLSCWDFINDKKMFAAVTAINDDFKKFYYSNSSAQEYKNMYGAFYEKIYLALQDNDEKKKIPSTIFPFHFLLKSDIKNLGEVLNTYFNEYNKMARLLLLAEERVTEIEKFPSLNKNEQYLLQLAEKQKILVEGNALRRDFLSFSPIDCFDCFSTQKPKDMLFLIWNIKFVKRDFESFKIASMYLVPLINYYQDIFREHMLNLEIKHPKKEKSKKIESSRRIKKGKKERGKGVKTEEPSKKEETESRKKEDIIKTEIPFSIKAFMPKRLKGIDDSYARCTKNKKCIKIIQSEGGIGTNENLFKMTSCFGLPKSIDKKFWIPEPIGAFFEENILSFEKERSHTNRLDSFHDVSVLLNGYLLYGFFICRETINNLPIGGQELFSRFYFPDDDNNYFAIIIPGLLISNAFIENKKADVLLDEEEQILTKKVTRTLGWHSGFFSFIFKLNNKITLEDIMNGKKLRLGDITLHHRSFEEYRMSREFHDEMKSDLKEIEKRQKE